MDKIKIILQDTQQPTIKIKSKDELTIDYKEQLSIVAPTQHSSLLGLDYESSGHTGFASEKALEDIRAEVSLKIPQQLSILPNVEDNYDKRKAYMYIDNNGNSAKITVDSLLDSKIRTVESTPEIWNEKEYIFKEIK